MMIIWIYDDLNDDLDASDFLNGLEALPKNVLQRNLKPYRGLSEDRVP